jgi:hypothetical protein
MYILISFFYISILAMAAMVLLKRRELATGRASLVSRVGAGTDHVFHATFATVRRGASYANRKNAVLFMHWIAFHILKAARTVYVAAKAKTLETPSGRKLLDAVRGRGEVRDHGASFYLRRISAEHPVK